MEIRDPVHGSISFTDGEVAVLDSREFQRLRTIKQLGFAEFSFPGATHNRYLHSLGVNHLVGQSFDSIFRAYPFSKPSVRLRLWQCVKLAAMLHDVGHGPLSHTTEQVMPMLSELNLVIPGVATAKERRADHEDYTLKFILDSSIAGIISTYFKDITPLHVACLVDSTIPAPDDFFVDNKTDFRPLLSQLVSSELDADRMDYLERDSYFCGTNYGRIDHEWLIQNMTFHRQNEKLYLALNRRALYSFDDFLISRHHMHLMVYFHHKSIIYEEMLNRYLTSDECKFFLPAKIEDYTKVNDYKLHEHLASVDNPWAKRIADRRPYRMLIEQHNLNENSKIEKIAAKLKTDNVDTIWASSHTRLSKYHMVQEDLRTIYVVDQYNPTEKPTPIQKATEIFKAYEGTRVIDRLYVSPEDFAKAEKIIRA